MSTRQKINTLKREIRKKQRGRSASRGGKLSESYLIKVKVSQADEYA